MITNKKDLSEHDIRTKFITPALVRAGWDLQRQIREEPQRGATFVDTGTKNVPAP